MRDASGARQFDAITATALLHSIAGFDYWALWPPDAVMETGSPVWHSVQTSPLSVHGFYITRDDWDTRWKDFDRNYTTETCEKNNITSLFKPVTSQISIFGTEYMADRNTSNYDVVFVFSCNADYSKKNFVQLGHLQVLFASKVII